MNHDPYLDAGMRGHLVSLAHKNSWRVAGYDFDDMLQEAYFCYYKCHARYVGKKPKKRPDGSYRRALPPKRPDHVAVRHFMRIVQRAFRNHIASMSAKQPALREVPVSALLKPDQTEEALWDAIMPPDDEVASASMLLSSAPEEIKQLFKILISDLVDGYRMIVGRDDKGRYRVTRRRETHNQRYCRLLGLPNDYDIVGEVDRHFQVNRLA